MWTQFQDKFVYLLVVSSQRTYKSYEIILAIISGAFLELLAVPVCLITIGKSMDNILGFRQLLAPNMAILLALFLFVIGLPWMLWVIYIQHTCGRGTPFPLIPTKILLSAGPYKYTRNPMLFGALFWLSGWAIIFNSPMALLVGVAVFAFIIIGYIKMFEEKELEQRFKEAYFTYRLHTPFLIPNLLIKSHVQANTKEDST